MADGLDPIPGRCPGLREGGPFGPQAREPPLWMATASMRAEGLRSLSPAQRAGFQARTPTSIQAPTGRDISARRSKPKRQHQIGHLAAFRWADRDHRMPLLPNPILPI